MLKFRVLLFAVLLGVSCAGVVPAYQPAPLTTIAKITSPLPYAAPRLTYAANPVVHAAPVAYTAPARAYAPAPQVTYAAPHAYAPVAQATYASPHAYAPAAPVAYAAPHAYAPAPYVAHAPAPLYTKVAAPVGYAAHAPVVAAPIAKAVIGHAVDTDYDPNPSYNYAYDIQDALTGDSKNQQESRQGDVVQGSYSLTEPDGTRRTVEYTADPVNGFNAVVHRQPAVVQKTVVAAHAPVAVGSHGHYASPVLSHY